MAGIYRPRHPERTVLYRVLVHHFERFVEEYEERFERTYGFAVLRREANEGSFFRPIVKEVVEKYLDCGNPRCGFALMNRIRFMRTANRCPDSVPALSGGAFPSLEGAVRAISGSSILDIP